MGTRANIIFLDDNTEICRLYRQFDGYPEGLGVELALIMQNLRIVNGFGTDDCEPGVAANGMGCLAAQIIAKLKDGIGNVYVEAPNGEISDWIEFVYIIRDRGGKPEITISTKTGPFPFNLQTADETVFVGSPAALLAKFNDKDAA